MLYCIIIIVTCGHKFTLSQGPGTAELVGLGGDSTWGEVLDSLETERMDEGTEEEPGVKGQGGKVQSGAAALKSKETAGKALGGDSKASDSEEEETVQLTDIDMVGDCGAEPSFPSQSGDRTNGSSAKRRPTPKKHGGKGTGTGVAGNTNTTGAASSPATGAASSRNKRRQRGKKK